MLLLVSSYCICIFEVIMVGKLEEVCEVLYCYLVFIEEILFDRSCEESCCECFLCCLE